MVRTVYYDRLWVKRHCFSNKICIGYMLWSSTDMIRLTWTGLNTLLMSEKLTLALVITTTMHVLHTVLFR